MFFSLLFRLFPRSVRIRRNYTPPHTHTHTPATGAGDSNNNNWFSPLVRTTRLIRTVEFAEFRKHNNYRKSGSDDELTRVLLIGRAPLVTHGLCKCGVCVYRFSSEQTHATMFYRETVGCCARSTASRTRDTPQHTRCPWLGAGLLTGNGRLPSGHTSTRRRTAGKRCALHESDSHIGALHYHYRFNQAVTRWGNSVPFRFK